ncbi:hypothetical protein HOD96_02360 [Candidatus Falkowbacteria bacterium]|jgi:hypothetical protein|nr:hypothetical protein [Candidatus Falkowbacteria bacterium]MBT4433450.1 hypothetical protein [Candidatus Falkowbacteria bacterium]
MIKKIFEKQKKFLMPMVKKAQKVIVAILLFLLYIFGFGLTAIILLIFNRKLLGFKKRDKNTFWEDAKGYETDTAKNLRQF